jgi:hypothetical protein
MRQFDETIRASLAAFGLEESGLDAATRARLVSLWQRLPDEARSSFGSLLYIELDIEREKDASIDSACVRRVAERIAKRAQRETHAAYRVVGDADIEKVREATVREPSAHSELRSSGLWAALSTHVGADDLALLHQRIVEGRSAVSLAAEYQLSRSQMSRRLRALFDRLANLMRQRTE